MRTVSELSARAAASAAARAAARASDQRCVWAESRQK